MSHTHKDDPHFVKANDPRRRERKPRHSARLHGRGECDFTENEPREGHYCGYWVSPEFNGRWYSRPRTSQEAHLEFWAQHRGEVRTQLRAALFDDDLFDEGGLDIPDHRHHPASGNYWW